MRRTLSLALGAALFLLSSCLGGTGIPGAGAPAPMSSDNPSAGGDASHFLVAPGGAAADKPPGPVTSNGDSEGIGCTKAEPPRLRYGSDLSLTVDQTSDPFPTLDLAASGQWDLQFNVETKSMACGVETFWVSHHPGMKVRFIQDPDNALGARSECDVPLDPPTTDPNVIVKPENDFHQLSVPAVSGKISMYYDFDDDWKTINGGWVNQGSLNCKDKNAFVPLTDDQYKSSLAFSVPLGSFNLRIPSSGSDSPTNRTRVPF